MVMDGTKEKVDEVTPPEPKETSKTYTEEQVTERERKVRSDALAEMGRLKKTNSEILARLDRMVKESEEAELDTYKDDPAELKRIRAEQGKKKAIEDLDRVNQELNEKNERLSQLETERNESTKERNAREIATRLNVDPAKLLKFAKLTDGTPEAIEEIAKDLPKITPQPKLKPDSNRSLGGNLTDEAIVANFIKDPYNPTNKELYREFRLKKQS